VVASRELAASYGSAEFFTLREQDRGTCGVQQVAARKSPGYAAMASKGLHRRHFSSATVDLFTVLLVAPSG